MNRFPYYVSVDVYTHNCEFISPDSGRIDNGCIYYSLATMYKRCERHYAYYKAEIIRDLIISCATKVTLHIKITCQIWTSIIYEF